MQFLIKMKKMNKIILITLFCFVCMSFLPLAADSPPRSSFKFYSTYLYSSLFPKIKSHLKPYRHFLKKDEAGKIVQEIYLLTMTDIVKNKIKVVRSPDIKIFKLESKKNVAFVLRTEFLMADEKETYKDLQVNIKIRKVFLIFIGPKAEGVKV